MWGNLGKRGYFCGMETIKKVYKTNINCGSCLSKVSPKMLALEGVLHWEVDLGHADRLMTVEASEEVLREVSGVVASAGFRAEEL
jgi:copper chaperone